MEVGRFLNADDVHYLGEEGISCNLFTYCVNNPVNNKDENGTIAFVVAGAIVGGIAIVALVHWAYFYLRSVRQANISGRGFKRWLQDRKRGIACIPVQVFSSVLMYAKKSKTSKKERATNAPSWVYSKPPRKDEKAKDYAKRILDDKYGKGNWKKGPRSDYSRIVKYCVRNLGMK